MMKRSNNITYVTNYGLELPIDRLDCLNVAYQFSLGLDDRDYQLFRPGGFRETIFLLMLAGF